MTRFARAKGSKASNEKLPNEATPWHLMKQQLEENKCKAFLDKKPSAKELLKSEKDTRNVNENNDWAEFDDDGPKSLNNAQRIRKRKSPSEIDKKPAVEDSQNDNADHTIAKKSKKRKKSEKTEEAEIGTNDNETSSLSTKKNENLNNTPSNETALDTPQSKDHQNCTVLSKRQKRNQKRKLETINNNANKRFKSDTIHRGRTREERIKERGEYKRRKPDNCVAKVMINGVEIEIVKYDGFPVKKEDADRLTELKQKLLMKGIPKSEVDAAMKLERRKAEKALARAKKLVCFHCRKSGHNLSDCPELGSEEVSTGICFKCGSTEHTHFECKVNKGATYGYAKCFICREQGHIAVQCPDNPKGMYPHGGCCKICGAVTHLKKDCPDLTKTKEESTVTVEKMDDTAVESLKKDKKEKDESGAVAKKIVKF